MKFKDTKYGDLTGQNYDGDIDVSDMKLTSLKGAPQTITGSFDCSNNNLTSLAGAPQTVHGDFICYYNNLTSLEGAPQRVEGYFNCSYNKLTSLEGASELVNGAFLCQKNKLVSLKGLKGVAKIKSVYCVNNSNEHLSKEWEIRKENPTMTEEEINEKMYELTQMEYYLSTEAKDIFLF